MRVGRFEYTVEWARLVSDVLSPPVVWALMAFPIAFRDARNAGQALLWVTVYVALVCIVPIVYIAVKVKSGEISDLHMRVRRQRIRPFLISIVCAAVAWALLRMMNAPDVMPLLALFSFVQLVVMLGITLIWQVSVHAISISGAAIALGVLFNWLLALLIAPLVILVGAARIKLDRHTPAQVIVGSAIGLMIPLILFRIVWHT